MARRERGGPIMFNLRVRPTSADVKVDREALDRVTRFIKDNDAVPHGWEVAYIEWNHPGKASTGWKRGTEEDLGFLGRILRKMPGAKLRAAEVEKEPKARRGRERELGQAIRRMERWHRARAKELHAVERLKTVEARSKHRKLAESYRKRYQKAQGRVEELGRGEVGEYELAVDYKGKKGRR